MFKIELNKLLLLLLVQEVFTHETGYAHTIHHTITSDKSVSFPDVSYFDTSEGSTADFFNSSVITTDSDQLFRENLELKAIISELNLTIERSGCKI